MVVSNQPIIPWVASWRAKHGSCGTCRDSRKARNGRGMCMLCAARKAGESRGRPRKAAGRAEPEPRIAPVLCFHGNVEGTTLAGRRYSTPGAQKDTRNIKNAS